MNNYLETAISLVLIFFIFSVIAYILQEILAITMEYRGRLLWKSLAQLFDEIKMEGMTFTKADLPLKSAPITNTFYEHPQIRSLRKNLDKFPSYIPSANFALAVMDEVAKKAPEANLADADMFKKIKLGLQTLVNTKGNIYTVLANLVETSADIKELQAKIETWYNEYMNRVTGWYKSHTTLTLRLIAVGVTLFFNINVIKLTKQIFSDAGLRTSLTVMAEKVADNPQMSDYYKNNFASIADSIKAANKTELDSSRSESQRLSIQKKTNEDIAKAADEYTKKRITAVDGFAHSLSISGLPIGWKDSIWNETFKLNGADTFWNIIWMLIGWAIAAGCISMGAPFWFDLLAKLVNVRRAGIIPDTNSNKK